MNIVCIDKYVIRIYGLQLSEIKQLVMNAYIYVLGYVDPDIKFTNHFSYVEVYDNLGLVKYVLRLYKTNRSLRDVIIGTKIYVNVPELRSGVLRVFLKLFYKETEFIKIKDPIDFTVTPHYSYYICDSLRLYREWVDSSHVMITRQQQTEPFIINTEINESEPIATEFNLLLTRLFLILSGCKNYIIYEQVANVDYTKLDDSIFNE